MVRFKIILFSIFISGICYAANISEPPKDDTLSVQSQQYIQTLYENTSKLEVVTTDPNGNRKGKYGNLVLYNNSGTYSLKYCTSSPNGTVWGALSGDVQYTDTRFKAGSFTRDLTTAGGNVSYTGVGFQPKAVLFFLAEPTPAMSWGFSDGTGANNNLGTSRLSDDSVFKSTSLVLISSTNGITAEQHALVNSLDADGFTLAWTKNGSPSGTATVYYLAFR